MSEGTAAQLWQAALLRLYSQVTRPNFDTWLKDTVGLRLEADPAADQGHTLVVGARSDFATEWLSEKLRPTISRTLSALDDQVTDVAFEVLGARFPPGRPGQPLAEGSPAAVEALLLQPPPPRPGSGHPSTATHGRNVSPRPRLNPRFTFDSFVVGPANRLAQAAAMAVASSPGSVYNPLVITAANGLGKTHLLHAIAHEALRADRHVVYASADQFANDYANASRDRRWDAFRRHYRGPDILIIDDVQFLKGKEPTLGELYRTLDELHGSSRQVVLAADRRPAQVPGLSLLGPRLQAGLTADIQSPNLQLRISILHAKAGALGLHLTNDVLEFLASHPSLKDGNVCHLEGCLLRVAAHARASRQPPTIEVAAQAMANVAPATTPLTLTPDAILAAVCDHFHLSRQLLASKSRDSQLAFARQVAMYLLREEARCTFTEIGRLMGNRDPSTVLYGCSKITRELHLLPDTQEHVQSLQRSLHHCAA